MADKLNLDPSNYSRREKGQIAMTLNDLAIIAREFAMSEAEIYTFNEKTIVSEPRASYGIKEDETCRMFRSYIKLLEEKVDNLEKELSKYRAK